MSVFHSVPGVPRVKMERWNAMDGFPHISEIFNQPLPNPQLNKSEIILRSPPRAKAFRLFAR
jgi:hypothetical protein